MANQNFKVKNGLEVGTGVTISSGIVTATSFSGNFSGNATSSTYATTAGIATYATSSGISTYASTAGVSTNVIGGIGSITQLQVTGVSTFGNLNVNGSTTELSSIVNIRKAAGGNLTAGFDSGGQATLYYNGTQRLQTSSVGVVVNGDFTVQANGNISAGSLDLDTVAGANGNIKATSGISTLGITTVTRLTAQQLNVSGVSTLGNTVVGGATTQLIVNGDARITGILTVGTSSITFNGSNDSVTIGTGVTIFGNTGIVSATEFRGNGANLTGVQPFPTGTLMLFQQTAAPTGWTKQTTHNDKALRVVSGSASSGGSTAFTSVFASRTPSGTVSVSNAAVTLTTSQIPSHAHSETAAAYSNLLGVTGKFGNVLTSNVGSTTGSAGGGGSHTHANTAAFTGTAMDFAVQYVDLIIASKN